MRVLGQFRATASLIDSGVQAIAWLRPDRAVVAVQHTTRTTVAVVDPLRRRTLKRVELAGAVSATEHTAAGLVLLTGAAGDVAPARLATVDADGTVRTVALPGVVVGVHDGGGAEHVLRRVQPGLAAPPDGSKASVVPPSEPVREVDLATGAVAAHELVRPSPLTRLSRWLVPAAQAKALNGPERYAVWAGDGTIAVSGLQWSTTRNAKGGLRVSARAAGVQLVDTRDWSSRTLDAGGSTFALASDVVLAQGGSWGPNGATSIGVRAYARDGTPRYRLFDGQNAYARAVGQRLWVERGIGTDRPKLDVVDAATGTVLRSLAGRSQQDSWPGLLVGDTSDY